MLESSSTWNQPILVAHHRHAVVMPSFPVINAEPNRLQSAGASTTVPPRVLFHNSHMHRSAFRSIAIALPSRSPPHHFGIPVLIATMMRYAVIRSGVSGDRPGADRFWPIKMQKAPILLVELGSFFFSRRIRTI
jgi:hypothetical protein